MVRGWCVSGRMKPFALAGLRYMGGVERTSRADVPGKSELQIGEISPFAPEGVKGGIWADGREAVPYGSFGFGRTVPGRVLGVCELTETTRLERGRRCAEFRRGSERGAGSSTESET